jgi:inorganic pyrophosphatase
MPESMSLLFKAHPWHGVPLGEEAPDKVPAYIEIVPLDTVKYELDKVSGLLRVDRPQLYSNVCPSLYGMIPQTLCGELVAELCAQRTGRPGIKGDGDPLDICVLTEKSISHGDFLLKAIPIGGLRLLDGDEADDKIIAVLHRDISYGSWRDVSDCPAPLLERLEHYFLTYKDAPGARRTQCQITHVYDQADAHEVIRRAHQDYEARFPGVGKLLASRFKEAEK